MIGVQDFIGVYDWTMNYIYRQFGQAAVEKYWGETIAFKSQNHAAVLIEKMGLQGMAEYWGYTLDSEEAVYRTRLDIDRFRIDMYECPSLGFLLRVGQAEYFDYCQHCMGWIKPVMDRAGFVIDHEHNHHAQCWWEMRKADLTSGIIPLPPVRDEKDVRLRKDWEQEKHDLWLASQKVH